MPRRQSASQAGSSANAVPVPMVVHRSLPKQVLFRLAAEREVLYSGAFGAGKTRALCLKLLSRVWARPTAREGLCRKHLVSLRATTLRTLLEPDGTLPAVLPPGSYHHRKSDRLIQVLGGGDIVYFGVDNPAKIASLNLSGVAVDEAVELSLEDWTMLRGRLRLSVPGLVQQLYASCNPGSPSHFLAQRFGLVPGSQAAHNCRVIQTCTTDNHTLPAAYVADLQSLTGVARRRFLDGVWAGSDGLVYDSWDRATHVRSTDVAALAPWRKLVVGMDVGYTNPSVMLLVAEDRTGTARVLAEFYKRQQLESDLVNAAKQWLAQYRPSRWVIDPAAAALRAAMHAAGVPVEEANNHIATGINAVHERLRLRVDGQPRLIVDPVCTQTILEFETYEWADGRDQPVKAHDHAMDALRYAIVSLDSAQHEPRLRSL